MRERKIRHKSKAGKKQRKRKGDHTHTHTIDLKNTPIAFCVIAFVRTIFEIMTAGALTERKRKKHYKITSFTIVIVHAHGFSHLNRVQCTCPQCIYLLYLN